MRIVGRLFLLGAFGLLIALVVDSWIRVADPSSFIFRASDEVRQIRWLGSVQRDGTLAVESRYTFSKVPAERAFEAFVPPRIRQVRINGQPVSISVSSRVAATIPDDGVLTMTYEVPLAALRTGDRAEVRAQVGISLISVTGFQNTEFQGALFHDGTGDALIRLTEVGGLRSDALPGYTRFTGSVGLWDEPYLVAELPADALDTPIVDTTGLEPVTGLHTASAGPTSRQTITAVALTALVAVTVLWALKRMAMAAGRRFVAVRGVPDELPNPPSDLDPALVGLLVGGAGSGNRSVVAGDLLRMAHDRMISIDGVDSERFVLTIPPGTRGRTAYEELVLNELRPQGQAVAAVQLAGPPLWQGEQPWMRRYVVQAVADARRRHLFGLTFRATVLVPVMVVSGILAIVAAEGSTLGVITLTAGSALALLGALGGGYVHTRSGLRARAEWLAYGTFLRRSAELVEVGAPGVVIWGHHLAYGAVLGVSPKAAAALSPRSAA